MPEQKWKQCGRSYCKKYLEYICVDDMGNLVNPNYISGNFSNILRKNGLRPIRFHDLRHSCASLLIKNKIPMKDVQVWMGHSSFATTANIYAHIDTDSKHKAADMISACISLSGSQEKKWAKKFPQAERLRVKKSKISQLTNGFSARLSAILGEFRANFRQKWQTTWQTRKKDVCQTKST